LSWIDAQLGLGSGKVTLTNAVVESSLLRAGLAGTMTLNDVMTNSTLDNLPTKIELHRSLVQRVKFLEAVGTVNGDFVALPHFYTIGGTLGKPDPHIDYTAITKWGISIGLKQLGGKDAQGVLGALGLGGKGGTNASNTNASGNLIQNVGGLLQKQASTNTATTNAPARKKGGFNLNDLLKK
jgi:hypothetical protein